MSELAAPNEHEQAAELFWRPPSLDELTSASRPWGPDDVFVIDDLTDEEWERFAGAVRE